MPNIEMPTEDRVSRIPETKRIVGMGRSSIYAMMNEKSPSFDPTFPRPMRLGKRSVGWALNELQSWLETRPRTGDERDSKRMKGGGK